MKAWIAILLMFLTLIIGMGLAGAGVWYWQNDIFEEMESEYIQKEATLNAKFEKQDTELSNLSTQVATSQSQLEEQETILKTLPLLFFTPGGSFEESEKKELKKKVFDPYVAYHADEGQDVVTMDIQTYDEDGDYLYVMDAYFADETHNGFLWGNVLDDSLWWYPECMDECEFTEEFSETYPEVVSAYKKQYEIANEGI
ncbi:hypothetical protein KKC88_01855 [Patescibacteria group bacterium]|nr:hypothetical protein [Patescibacteria group bacterium]MBU1673866.1 hypothetical protein [Patescibacteria group bacterium]MBU1963243.1 hypothetical protein [Patescibacteria group bacterium]